MLGKTISTNEKLVLTYKDIDEKDYIVTLSNSPKIKLSEKQETKKATKITEKEDKTTAKGTIPQTGIDYLIICAIIGMIVIIVFAYNKVKQYKDVK